jgi:hypothetical protein
LGLANVFRCKVSAGFAIAAILCILIVFSNSCPGLQAQTGTSFTPKDDFGIPAYHGSISFGVNGSYSTATMDNDSWIFTNLLLDWSLPIETLKFSAQNCNVTIFSYQSLNITTFDIMQLRYVVEGHGVQILNLGVNSTQSGISASAEWNIVFGNRNFVAEGDGWYLSHDGTLTITGATAGNVTVLHYIFLNVGNAQNLSFYQQHSVAIAVAVAIAVTVAVAVAIKVKTREPSAKMKQEKMQR